MLRWSWIIGFLLGIWGASLAAAADTVQVREDFAKDPRWEGRNNRPDPAVCRDVKQDFGFSQTSHAGGSTGEIGGRVCRSLRLATYAKPIRPRTLNDRLHASGRLAVTQSRRRQRNDYRLVQQPHREAGARLTHWFSAWTASRTSSACSSNTAPRHGKPAAGRPSRENIKRRRRR